MVLTLIQQLLNSGSKAMNVNGGTPKTFGYSPGSGSIALLGLSCTLKDDGATDLTKFGAITALTNGILLQYSIGGSTQTLTTIKDNSDLTHTFYTYQHFGNSATLSILSIVTPQGFGNSTNVFRGVLLLQEPVILTDSDAINAIVQDNLTSIDVLNMSAFIRIDA